MIDCHQIEILLASRRDLSAAQERVVQAHLSGCPACAATALREERTTAVLRALPVRNTRPPERVATAIRAMLAGTAPPPRWRLVRIRHIRYGLDIVFGLMVSMVIIVLFGMLLSQRRPNEPSNSALAAPTVAPPTPQHGTLYLISYGSGPNGQTGTSHITAVELATQTERYTIDNADDVILSPDGSRLYYAGFAQDQDYLVAADAQTGRAIWRAAITNRMAYKGGGPSVLAVSPDGRWVYIHSLDSHGTFSNAELEMPYWLQIVDTRTGTVLPEIIGVSTGPYCSGPNLITPPSGTELYLACSDILVLDSKIQRITQKIPVTGAGALMSPDGRWLYVVSSNLHIDIVDLQKHAIAQKVDQNSTNDYANVFPGLVALAADGNTLVTGQILEETPGTDTATRFRVFDTRTWQKIAEFRFERPVVQYALALSADGATIYAVARSRPDGPADTVVELDARNGQIRAEHKRPGEDIARMFIAP